MVARPVGADSRFTSMWLGWIALFCGIEGSAVLRHRPQDTLSRHVRCWCDRPLLIGFMAWLLGHLLADEDA